MDVVGAREAFYSWNNQCLKQLYRQYDQSQQQALQLIPLLLQINSRLLPGYNGADVPAGIYAYKPDNKLIGKARQLNNRFSYHQEGVLKNTLIESVYLQSSILDDGMCLWVIHAPYMKPDQYDELNDKINRIIIWLKSRNLFITSCLTSAEKLSAGDFKMDDYTSTTLFLDDFYVQSILLAGKYPIWWLVPPEEEIEYDLFVERIKNERFVNENEFIDTGSVIIYKKDDFLSQAIKDVQGIYKSPEIVLFKLLLLGAKQKGWSKSDGLAMRLKTMMYQENCEYSEMVPVSVLVAALKQEIEHELQRADYLRLDKMLMLMQKFSVGINSSFIRMLIGDSGKQRDSSVAEEISRYLGLYKSLFVAVKSVFDKIISCYRDVDIDASNQQMLDAANNFSEFLSESYNRVPVYNFRARSNLFQPKILIRHIDDVSGYKWVLAIDRGEGIEETLYMSFSLLGVISWGVLNRVVDISTLVSVNSPERRIRQIDARYAMEVLLKEINVDIITNVPPEAFNHEAHPLRSLVFVNDFRNSDSAIETVKSRQSPDIINDTAMTIGPLISCEQLVINSWGDSYIQQYMGNDGVFQCLCEWMNASPLSRSVRPHAFNVYAYAVGDSTSLAQRIMQIYDDLIEFFYTRKQHSGRFIARMAQEYFCFEVISDKFEFHSIGNQSDLFMFLEQPTDSFSTFEFDRHALPEIPLKEIYSLNKPDVIQLFFQVGAQYCMSWVLDENGSLCRFQQKLFEMESFIKQWLLSIRNIRNQLKKINYNEHELPRLEIFQLSINQLGGLDFYPVEPDSVRRQRDFIDVYLRVNNDNTIALVCEGHVFDYENFSDAVMDETVAYIKQQFSSAGRLPVYITDIDIPINLLGFDQGHEPQTIHYLKYKRDLENRIACLL